ncbi:MAG: hypothetical protein DRR04_10385 [Gammaproteobacteria bacterium]|nr:MAG: hypothetical protein DRR04_10385 [Gammaproteobacteria bacterium]
MSKVRVVNKMPEFQTKMAYAMEGALREMASDILIESRNKAPVKNGHLRGESYSSQFAPLVHRVEYLIEYAEYQERGARKDGTHVVRKYTTAGTGAHFLEKTAEKYNLTKLKGKWRKHAQRVTV